MDPSTTILPGRDPDGAGGLQQRAEGADGGLRRLVPTDRVGEAIEGITRRRSPGSTVASRLSTWSGGAPCGFEVGGHPLGTHLADAGRGRAGRLPTGRRGRCAASTALRIRRSLTLMVNGPAPMAANRSCTTSTVSMSATALSVPMVSKSHWRNSRYRPFCGFSPRHTGAMWYRLNGIPRTSMCWAAKRARGTVRSKRIATSRPPASSNRYICFSASAPPPPVRISANSNAGVSMGA